MVISELSSGKSHVPEAAHTLSCVFEEPLHSTLSDMRYTATRLTAKLIMLLII